MRPKNLNTGLRGGVFEAKHCRRMGQAIWLYGWLVLRQTTERGTTGLVLGGRAITYREIEEETGFNRRTLERWMRRLRQQGYIETSAAAMDRAATGVVVRILKAKKFGAGQKQFDFASTSTPERRNSFPYSCVFPLSIAARRPAAAGLSASPPPQICVHPTAAVSMPTRQSAWQQKLRAEQAQRDSQIGKAPELTTGSVKSGAIERLRQRFAKRTGSAGG